MSRSGRPFAATLCQPADVPGRGGFMPPMLVTGRRDPDLPVVLKARVDHAILRLGCSVRQQRVEAGLGAQPKAVLGEVAAGADVLLVVPAVVAGQERHA